MDEERSSITSIPISTPTFTPPKDQHLRLGLPLDPLTPEDHLVPFFGGRRGRRYHATWVISLFVFLHLIAFFATLFVNDCPRNSGDECFLRPLGRFSFQPLFENPLVGPSSSTLVKMGALQRPLMIQRNKMWHLLMSPWLHAGVIHLIVNLSSVLLVGIHLEQEFGLWRAAVIYLFSAFLGSLTSAVFVEHIPAVVSSASLFGLLGATLAGLIQNWKIYVNKFSALAVLGSVAIVNFCIGLLPYVDNISNIGDFLTGILLGIILLFNPQLAILERKKGLFDYDLNRTVRLKQKLDKPASRIIAFFLFITMLTGGLVAVFLGVNACEDCLWFRYINCVPTKMWSCNEKASNCEATISDGRLTLTCAVGDRFRTFPFANVSQQRMDDLCTLICP